MRTLLAGLASALLAAAPAAAATWSAPTTVSAPHTFVSPVGLTQSVDGSLEAWWSWQQGTRGAATLGSAHARHAAGAAGFGAEHAAPGDLLDVRAYGQSRLLALSQTLVRASAPQVLRVVATFGRTGGDFGSPETIDSANTVYRPQLAVSSSGRAIVAYVVSVDRRRIVRAATRVPGGRFSRPFTLSGRGQADTVAAAVGERGDVVVAFERNGRLLARMRRAGHRWGAVQQLAVADGATQWQVQAAVDARGRAEVVWRRHQLARSGVPGRRSIEASYMPVGSYRFRSAQVVEPDGASAPSPLVLVPGGFAVAYAEDAPDTPHPATNALPRVRIAAPRFGGPLDAGPAGGGLRDVTVAAAPGGSLLATWVQPTPTGDGAGVGQGALVVQGGTAFGPVEAVTPEENVVEIVAGFDPRSGRAVAAWAARPEGTGPSVPVSQTRTVVRSAERSP